MSIWTPEKIEETAAKVVERIGPTLVFKDLQAVIPSLMEVAEDVMGMKDEEKHQTAVALLKYVLDHTDTPWLPDAASDPLFLKIADQLVIPVICKAARGGYRINEPEPM